MLTIWDQPVLSTVPDIIKQLRMELKADNINLLKDMKPTSKNIMVTCPFHANGTERKPSCGISTVDTRDGKKTYPAGTAHCFTCGYSSDLPEFISNVLGRQDNGMTGYKWITSRFASVTVEQRKPLQLNMTRGRGVVAEQQLISEEELQSYRFVHDYMYYRKLNDKVIEYFDVGYDTKTDSLTFPVHDLNGNVPFMQRRSVGKKGFLNAEDVEKGKVVYGLYHIYNNLSWIKEVYICESIIDALTLWTYRIPAVAIMGALPTNEQLRLLAAVPVRRYIVAIDNPIMDMAGCGGTVRLADGLRKTKIVHYLKFPDGVKDINEMTTEQIEERDVVNYQYFDPDMHKDKAE